MSKKQSDLSNKKEFEMERKIANFEQQIQQKLPKEWQTFAGPPGMKIQYFNTQINTFRENPHVQPSHAFINWMTKELEQISEEYVRFSSFLCGGSGFCAKRALCTLNKK